VDNKSFAGLTQRRNELAKQYQWKAENILRFLDKLGMTKKQKEKFIADELAQAYMNAEYTELRRAYLWNHRRGN
jgi:hypothetical protein